MNCDSSGNSVNKVPFDPGWNDPPPLSFSSQQTTKPRNFLNKRVAFPISAGASPTPNTLTSMPLAAGFTPPPSAPLTRSLQKDPINNEDFVIDSSKTLEEVKSILMNILEESSELNSKANDIKKRLNVMEEMWTGGNLNSQIQAQMKDLSLALKDNPKRADEIHQALMVQHVSAVSSWMPGIRQLIHSSIARAELLSIDNEA